MPKITLSKGVSKLSSALPIVEKVAYVKKQRQTRNHSCHWPGCTNQVPPALWGCLSHWRKLPKYLRDKIWATYAPGQEVDGSPSDEYIEAALVVREWIKTNYRCKACNGSGLNSRGDSCHPCEASGVSR